MTRDGKPSAEGRAFAVKAIVIAVIALALSVVWSANFRPHELRFDENYYYPLAQKAVKGTYEDGYVIRGPLYPLFLSGVFRIFGEGFKPAMMVQSILRGLVVLLVIYMGRRYMSEGAGLVAGLLLTIFPGLLAMYMSFLTEVVYIPLFLLSFYFIDRATQAEGAPDTIEAGIASGLAALVRSTSLFLTGVIAAWWVVGKSKSGRFSRHNLARAVLLLIVMFVTISPWTIRNAVVHGGFIAIGDDSAFNLWLITSGMRIRPAVREWKTWGTHPERQQEAYSRWLAYLREDPGFHIKRLGVVLPRILSPGWESPARVLSTIEREDESKEISGLRSFFTVLHPVIFWIIFGGGLVGLVALEKNGKRKTVIFVIVVYFVLIHGMTLARSRFMLPLLCLLSIYAGGLVSAGVRRMGRSGRLAQ